MDVITSFETIEHVEDDVAVLNEFHRVMSRDGDLIISTPNNWPLEIAPHHVQTYTRDSFEATLEESGFEVVEFWNQNSGTDWIYNHGQKRGITRTNQKNEVRAECLIAVCQRLD